MHLVNDPSLSGTALFLLHISLLLIASTLAWPNPWCHGDRRRLQVPPAIAHLLRRLWVDGVLILTTLAGVRHTWGLLLRLIVRQARQEAARLLAALWSNLPQITAALTRCAELIIAIATLINALLTLAERFGR